MAFGGDDEPFVGDAARLLDVARKFADINWDPNKVRGVVRAVTGVGSRDMGRQIAGEFRGPDVCARWASSEVAK